MDRTGIGLLLVCLLCVSTRVLGQTMVNVAPGKTCRQSTTTQAQGPSCNAANRNTRGTFSSNNCIQTLGNTYMSNSQLYTDYTPWWEVDLGRTYPVQDIKVFARSSLNGRLYPFNITVDDQLCVRVSNGNRLQSVRCSSVMYGQVVRLTKDYTDIPDNKYLGLCELEVLVPSGVSQCPAGRYGQGCGQTCSSNCGGGLDKNFCNINSAVCYDGCVGNFAGDFCADCMENFTGNRCQDCTVGNYGTNCGSTCYVSCAGGCARDTGYCTHCAPGYYKSGNQCVQCSVNCKNSRCYSNTGRCAGCRDGRWRAQCGSHCKRSCGQCNQNTGTCTACSGFFKLPECTECLEGYYKENSFSTRCTECTWQCLDNTVCSNTTGDCADCPPGKTGNRCDQACAPNMYGENCSESCGRCKGEQPCNTTTGECSGECQPGYTGTLCKTECGAGLYGAECNQTCGGCQVNTTCHHEDGHCLAGCVAEFAGPLCLQANSQENKDDGATKLVGPIVGSIVGVGLVMTISITAAICWRRKSATSRSSVQDPPTASSISGKDAAPTVSPEPSPLRQSSSNEDHIYSEIRDPDDTYEISEMQSIYDKPSPYSNDDGDREPYMQLTSKTNDVNIPASNAAYVNTKLSV